MNASSSEVWPSLSRSASVEPMASAMCWPKREKLTSTPLRVAVTTTRLGPARAGTKGPLDDEQSTTATGRLNGLSNAASRAAVRSGPRRLKAASLAVNVPWPISTSHSSASVSLVSAVRAISICARSFVSFEVPINTDLAEALAAAAVHLVDHSANCLPNSSSPAAPTTMMTVG